MSNFQKLAAARAAELPTIQIGEETYHVKEFKGSAMEQAELTQLCNAIARKNHVPTVGDDDPFAAPRRNGEDMDIFREWHGYYRATTRKDAQVAETAATMRSAAMFAFQVVDKGGQRPWASDLEEFAALIGLVESTPDLLKTIGELSSITKIVQGAQKEKAPKPAEVDPGN